MAVSPTPPPITLLPSPPLPTDPESVFDSKAGASLTAQAAMVPEVNAALAWQAGSMAETKGYKDAAATSAQTATEQAAIASGAGGAAAAQVALAAEQVTLAATQANNAAASATAAESAPGSIGNLALLHAVALSF